MVGLVAQPGRMLSSVHGLMDFADRHDLVSEARMVTGGGGL